MQISLTLTQEVVKNCTFAIPEFHKVIRQWGVGVVGRKDNLADHDNNCLKINCVYIAVNKAKYGDYVPAICRLGDIRIS